VTLSSAPFPGLASSNGPSVAGPLVTLSPSQSPGPLVTLSDVPVPAPLATLSTTQTPGPLVTLSNAPSIPLSQTVAVPPPIVALGSSGAGGQRSQRAS
jgi:hypothetical protein